MMKKIRFPLPALRSMTAAPAETVCALPVTSRNSVTGAAPAKISPARRNPVPDMRAHTATKTQSGRRQIKNHLSPARFLFLTSVFRQSHRNFSSFIHLTDKLQCSSKESNSMFYNGKTKSGSSDLL